ncbi:hypothetical protein AAZX31_14G068100 [Glycine max]
MYALGVLNKESQTLKIVLSAMIKVEGIFGRWYIYIFGCSAGGGDFWKVVQQRVGFRWRGFLKGGAGEGWFQDSDGYL